MRKDHFFVSDTDLFLVFLQHSSGCAGGRIRKRSHLQLVSCVAKTCTNMSRLAANTSHPVNNHCNSNPDTYWTNLVVRTAAGPCRVAPLRSQVCEELLLAPACLSVRPRGTTGLPLDELSWNLRFEYFWKICEKKFNFTKIWKGWRYLNWRPCVHLG
jgi:hypothetical protein